MADQVADTPFTVEDLKNKSNDLFVAVKAILRLVGKTDWLDEEQMVENIANKPVVAALVVELVNSVKFKRSPNFTKMLLELFSTKLGA